MSNARERRKLNPRLLVLLHHYEPERIATARNLAAELERRGRSVDEAFRGQPYWSGMRKVANDDYDHITPAELASLLKATGIPESFLRGDI